MNQRTLSAIAVAILVIVPLSGPAHQGATGVVKERMALMKQMGKAMKQSKQALRPTAEYDPAVIGTLAATIRTGAGDALSSKFPPGTADRPSEARMTIWESWSKFESLSLELEERALELETAVGRTEAEAAFARVGETCKSCHKQFRQKKKKH